MTVPFQHKTMYREIMEFAGSLNKMSKEEMHQFNAYIPTPFSQTVFDKYEPLCPLNVDDFMGFVAMGQAEVGDKFDVISWGYVRGYARHHLMGGEDKAALKDVRKSIDFTLKSSYKEPLLTDLWVKEALSGASADPATISIDEVIAVLRVAAKKPVPLLELLRSCMPKGRGKGKSPPTVTPPAGKSSPAVEEKKEEPNKKEEMTPPAEPASPKKVSPPPPPPPPAPKEPTPTVEPAKVVTPPPTPPTTPREEPAKLPAEPPVVAVSQPIVAAEEPVVAAEEPLSPMDPLQDTVTVPSAAVVLGGVSMIAAADAPPSSPIVAVHKPSTSPVQSTGSPLPVAGVMKASAANSLLLGGPLKKGQSAVSFDELEATTAMSQGSATSGGGLLSQRLQLNSSFGGSSAQLAQYLNNNNSSSGGNRSRDMGVGANIGGSGGGSRLPPEVVAMAAELDAQREALKSELDKELELLGSNNDAINTLQERLQLLKAKNAVAPGDEAQYFLAGALRNQQKQQRVDKLQKGGSGGSDDSKVGGGSSCHSTPARSSFTGIDLAKVEDKMKNWINASQQQQHLMKSEIHRLRQKEQLDASLRVIGAGGDYTAAASSSSSPYRLSRQPQYHHFTNGGASEFENSRLAASPVYQQKGEHEQEGSHPSQHDPSTYTTGTSTAPAVPSSMNPVAGGGGGAYSPNPTNLDGGDHQALHQQHSRQQQQPPIRMPPLHQPHQRHHQQQVPGEQQHQQPPEEEEEEYYHHHHISSSSPQRPHSYYADPGVQRLESMQGATQELNLHSALRVTQFNEELQKRSLAVKEKEAALERLRNLQKQEQALEEELMLTTTATTSRSSRYQPPGGRTATAMVGGETQTHQFKQQPNMSTTSTAHHQPQQESSSSSHQKQQVYDQIEKQRQYALQRARSSGPGAQGGGDAPSPSPSPFIRAHQQFEDHHQYQPPQGWVGATRQQQQQPGSSSSSMYSHLQPPPPPPLRPAAARQQPATASYLNQNDNNTAGRGGRSEVSAALPVRGSSKLSSQDAERFLARGTMYRR